jgi:hypothetical protein
MGCLLSILAFVFGIAIFGSTASMASQVSVASDLPIPLVILRETGEGAYVRGSDTTFVLYDTGQVISRRYGDGEYELASAILDTDEFESLLATFNIGDEFYALDDYYEASEWTDQIYYEICVSDEDHGDKCVSVYGYLSLPDPFTPSDIAQETRDNTPEVFLQLFDEIMAFDHPDAVTWLPDVYAVTIAEFESNRAADLPDDMTVLFDPTSTWDEPTYTAYFNGEQYADFLELVRGESTVSIDERTWSYSIHFLYPHEEIPDPQTVP